jgi:hypothetical protein
MLASADEQARSKKAKSNTLGHVRILTILEIRAVLRGAVMVLPSGVRV